MSNLVELPAVLEVRTERFELVYSLVKILTIPLEHLPEVATTLEMLSNFLIQHSHAVLKSISNGSCSSFRPIIQAVFVILDVSSTSKESLKNSRSLQRVLVNVFDVVVCNLGGAILTKSQTSPSASLAEDLCLVIAVGRMTLRYPGIRPVFPILAAALHRHGTAMRALDLFSHSDSLYVEGKLIYGDLSLQFINLLLEIPHEAEHILSNGLIRTLLESPVCSRLQDGGVAAHVAETASLHHIWIQGILPIILNLTITLSTKLQRDLEVFVDAYAKQINFCLTSWDRPKILTSAAVDETFLLALLFELLRSLSSTGNSEYDKGRLFLADRIQYMLNHPKFLGSLLYLLPGEDAEITETTIHDQLRQIKQVLIVD